MDLYNRLELGDLQNIEDADYEQFLYAPIYQILPIAYLKNILANSVLRFRNVKRAWDDPYELFLYKEALFVEGKNLEKLLKDWSERFYGQCWSLNEDTDAMWRIYSHDKQSVRIKTTVIDMIKILDQTRGMMWTAPIFGKVNYLTDEDIICWLREFEKMGWGSFINVHPKSLFLKRKEFCHENEVRFILFQTFDYDVSEYIELKVTPSQFIKEIALDPRLSDSECERMRDEIRLLEQSIPIIQSNLYKFDKIKLYLKDTPIVLGNN